MIPSYVQIEAEYTYLFNKLSLTKHPYRYIRIAGTIHIEMKERHGALLVDNPPIHLSPILTRTKSMTPGQD